MYLVKVQTINEFGASKWSEEWQFDTFEGISRLIDVSALSDFFQLKHRNQESFRHFPLQIHLEI